MVNAFAKMVTRGQVSVTSGAPSHNQGDLPLDEGDKLDSTQQTTFKSKMVMKLGREL